MNAQQNERLTRTGPGTDGGALLRRYWQPVALVDEFDPATDPRMAQRPLKAVRVMGQDLVLFRDDAGRWGLLDRDCPHRGADLAYGRLEGDGLRCPFLGWKFEAEPLQPLAANGFGHESSSRCFVEPPVGASGDRAVVAGCSYHLCNALAILFGAEAFCRVES